MGEVTLVLATSTGGVGRHVAGLVEGLTAAGWATRVVGPPATDRLFGFTRRGAEFHPAPFGGAADPVPAVRAWWSLRQTLAGSALLHAHGLRAGLLTQAAAPAGAAVLVSWHNLVLGPAVRRAGYRPLERWVARHATVTLAASADLAERARRLGGRDVRLVPVAAPPLPPAGRDPAQVRAELGATGRPLLLAVGRLHPQKGFDVLVRAAARWARRQPAPVVAVAGEGPDRRRLERMVVRSGAPVRLLGRRDDVADLLAAADLVVLPSRWEARPLVAQEALRAGVPLVTTSVGGIPDLVGEAAALVPAGDVTALATTVQDLLDDPARCADLAARGPLTSRTWPQPADTVAAVLSLYLESTSSL